LPVTFRHVTSQRPHPLAITEKEPVYCGKARAPDHSTGHTIRASYNTIQNTILSPDAGLLDIIRSVCVC